jgi:hypothetical protein
MIGNANRLQCCLVTTISVTMSVLLVITTPGNYPGLGALLCFGTSTVTSECVEPDKCRCYFGYVGDNCTTECLCNKHSNCESFERREVCTQWVTTGISLMSSWQTEHGVLEHVMVA